MQEVQKDSVKTRYKGIVSAQKTVKAHNIQYVRIPEAIKYTVKKGKEWLVAERLPLVEETDQKEEITGADYITWMQYYQKHQDDEEMKNLIIDVAKYILWASSVDDLRKFPNEAVDEMTFWDEVYGLERYMSSYTAKKAIDGVKQYLNNFDFGNSKHFGLYERVHYFQVITNKELSN